MMHFVSCISCH